MKRLLFLVVSVLFLFNIVFAGGFWKRLSERVTNTFKSEIEQEINSQKNKLMKEFMFLKEEADTISKKWTEYNNVKIKLEKVKNKGNTAEIVAHLIIVSKWAKLLERKDIVSWQYNNIGYECIKKFNQLTNNGTKKVEEAEQYLKEAKKYLKKAEKIEKTLKIGKERKEKIKNNLKYVKNKEKLF